MQSAKEKQEHVQSSRELALLTGKERDWLLGNLDLSKPYEYRLRSSIKRKIRTFVDFELPLLVKNNLIISYEESRRKNYSILLGKCCNIIAQTRFIPTKVLLG